MNARVRWKTGGMVNHGVTRKYSSVELASLQIEAIAKRTISHLQENWDRHSEETRELFIAGGHKRPKLTNKQLEKLKALAGLIDGALLLGDFDRVDRALEAADPKSSVQWQRAQVLGVFERALAWMPEGKIGRELTQSSVEFTLATLPRLKAEFKTLSHSNLATLFCSGRLASAGRNRQRNTGAAILAAEASCFCGAFGDNKRSVDHARADFDDARNRAK